MRNSGKLAVAALLVATMACALSPEPTPTPLPTATNTPVPPTPVPTDTPTPEPGAGLPETSVTAVLGFTPTDTYKVAFGSFAALPFEDSELPAAPGSVEAWWYVAGDRYVVAYVGLDVANAGPLCPGNSIFNGSSFANVSNAPTEEGACEGFSTLTTDPDVGPRVCMDTLLYVTAIPSSASGSLFGTLEALADGGEALIGMTSAVESAPEMPTIDLDQVCG